MKKICIFIFRLECARAFINSKTKQQKKAKKKRRGVPLKENEEAHRGVDEMLLGCGGGGGMG